MKRLDFLDSIHQLCSDQRLIKGKPPSPPPRDITLKSDVWSITFAIQSAKSQVSDLCRGVGSLEIQLLTNREKSRLVIIRCGRGTLDGKVSSGDATMHIHAYAHHQPVPSYFPSPIVPSRPYSLRFEYRQLLITQVSIFTPRVFICCDTSNPCQMTHM